MNQTILKLHKLAKLTIQCGEEMSEGVDALGRQVAAPDIKTALLELLHWPAPAVRLRCVEVLGRKYLDVETRNALGVLLVSEKSQRVIDAVNACVDPPKP